MINAKQIGVITRQLEQASRRVDSLTNDIEEIKEDDASLAEMLSSFRLDELEHIQQLTLALSEMAIEDENGDTHTDGSVFAEGELTSIIPEAVEPKEKA